MTTAAKPPLIGGIDATVELTHFLDASTDPILSNAPRSKALYRYLAKGQQESGTEGDRFSAAIETLVRALGVWWSPAAYQRMPVMTPWCVRDRSCRYDQGPEAWGAPLATGYLRDDNSIIKKLPLPVEIVAPEGHAYRSRKPWRGFTACHVWRVLSDETIAGEDPWLYSFMPNLVWLPSWLAPLSDKHGSRTQSLLQEISVALYRDVALPPPLRTYADRAWQSLQAARVVRADAAGLACFAPGDAFFARRLKTIDLFAGGCAEVLDGRKPTRKIICSRYTAGLPELPATSVRSFARAIEDYAAAVRAGDPSGVA